MLGSPDQEQVLARLQQAQRVSLHGANASYLAMLVSGIGASGCFPWPIVVVTADEDAARHLARDIAFFLHLRAAEPDVEVMNLPHVMHLPQVETSPYTEISPDRVAIMQRMGALFRLSQDHVGQVLVISASALQRRVIPQRGFSDLSELVQAEEEVDRDQLLGRLVACGFNRTQVVEDPGTFSVRGGIIDLFPPLFRFPARIELWGDLVESIRLFDPVSQRTLRPIQEVVFHPVRETILIDSSPADLRRRILRAADEARHPSSRTRLLLEELETGREFFGIESLTPAFHEQLVPLTDYLPQGALWVVQGPEPVRQLLVEEDARAESAHESRRSAGRLTFPPGAFFVDADTLDRTIASQRRLEARLTEDGGPAVHAHCRGNDDIAAELQLARSEKGQEILKVLVRSLRRWQSEGRPVLVACGGPGGAARLHALLGGYGLETRLLEPGQDPGGAAGLSLIPGELGQGFRLPGSLVVLTEEEIFGPKTRRRTQGPTTLAGSSDLGQLQEGEPAVHAQHGIGTYLGLKKLEIQGVPADFLLLEYAGGDRLYVPVYRMNLVQKYSGGEVDQVKLDRLGGVTWARKRGKVKGDVRRMAEELLQLYAQRAALEGVAHPPGDAIYHEFEATFPFTETTDQLRAVDDVLHDLTSSQPMDRLVCGDVGFGKTEVALRAAFLVAMSARQVAVLAPTTVLVEQHLRSFTDRLGRYPLRVEGVSRFRTRKELSAVLGAIADGKVDIAIGTHRLLQPDVRFKDVGLVIVDEEHRFGVAHKERLKRMRTQVDVLTMTATPIPRTLHMGMIGMRSISIISTPPVDRLAIRTFVCRYDESLVAEAIRKELDRGGQVFFVHNRVQTIDEWARRVSDLVPRARVVVGHGQMDPRRLERVMVDFVGGKFDILVCSTIIESGLDIPRANTMFINRADQLGLAQLYQLRGRIGRSRHRAFCYLLVPGVESLSDAGRQARERGMTDTARQRLATLQRFTELGSGFSVASHDLEIRGAGELLGAKQSGQIAAVGFETYARILEEAVAELRGEPITRETDPELNTGVAAFIPDDYVDDVGQRLDLYKRLSSAGDEDRVRGLLAEMRDRYGPEPPEVEALGELMVIKGLAAALQATVVDLSPGRLSLTLSEDTPLTPEQAVELVRNRSSGFRLTPQMRLIRSLTEAEARDPLSSAKKVLHALLAHANQSR